MSEAELIQIPNWKGKDNLIISEGMGFYAIREHRKEKETGEIKDVDKIIPKHNVDELFNLIKENCEKGIEYKYKYLVRKLLEKKNFHKMENCPIEIFMEAFNGGKNRAKYYFPYLYYPLKILEAKKQIMYLGKGGIILY